jgi:hypothetical protein
VSWADDGVLTEETLWNPNGTLYAEYVLQSNGLHYNYENDEWYYEPDEDYSTDDFDSDSGDDATDVGDPYGGDDDATLATVTRSSLNKGSANSGQTSVTASNKSGHLQASTSGGLAARHGSSAISQQVGSALPTASMPAVRLGTAGQAVAASDHSQASLEAQLHRLVQGMATFGAESGASDEPLNFCAHELNRRAASGYARALLKRGRRRIDVPASGISSKSGSAA